MTEIQTLDEMLKEAKETERLASLNSLDALETSRLKDQISRLKGRAFGEFNKPVVSGSYPTPYRSCLLTMHRTLSALDTNSLPDSRTLARLMGECREEIQSAVKRSAKSL